MDPLSSVSYVEENDLNIQLEFLASHLVVL